MQRMHDIYHELRWGMSVPYQPGLHFTDDQVERAKNRSRARQEYMKEHPEVAFVMETEPYPSLKKEVDMGQA